MAAFRRISVALLVAVCWVAGTQPARSAVPFDSALPTLFLVGNTDPAIGLSIGRMFDRTRINVIDRSAAASGVRSTLYGGSWAATLAMVRPGDVVLVDFSRAAGAADETESLPGVSDEARRIAGRSAPQGSDVVVQSYGWYLRRYAVEVIARGATPLLCAPVVAGDAAEQSREQEWTKAIAVQQHLPFLDAVAARSTLHTAPHASSPDQTSVAIAIVAALQGLPDDPLSGYFSAEGKVVPPYRPPPPPPLAGSAPTAPLL